MLPEGARVTCYLQALFSHGSGEEVDRIGRSHGSLRRRRMRASPSEPTSRLQRSSQGLLGLILEQSIESLNQGSRWSSLDDFTDLVGKANGHKLRKGRYTAQDHVADSPLDVVIQAWRERPVSDEARLCSHSLHFSFFCFFLCFKCDS